MGRVFADIALSNPRQPAFEAVRVRALADTGALILCIPQHVANQLDLATESLREVTVADGCSAKVPYVGPIKVTFGKRFCYFPLTLPYVLPYVSSSRDSDWVWER